MEISPDIAQLPPDVELKTLLQVGLDQLERGEYIEIKGEASLRAFFDNIQTRVQQSLS